MKDRINEILEDWKKEGVIDDRLEYDLFELGTSFPDLEEEEIEKLYIKLHELYD